MTNIKVIMQAPGGVPQIYTLDGEPVPEGTITNPIKDLPPELQEQLKEYRGNTDQNLLNNLSLTEDQLNAIPIDVVYDIEVIPYKENLTLTSTEDQVKNKTNPKTGKIALDRPAKNSYLITGSAKGFNMASKEVYRKNLKDKFMISYKDLAGTKKEYYFDLLPAIENRGSRFGNADVPEVKPGILQRIDTKHKNILIPGSTPVVQTIGINNTMLNLVGCFTGEEKINIDPASNRAGLLENNVLYGSPGELTNKNVSSNKNAKQFMDDVVLPGTAVDLEINSTNFGGELNGSNSEENIKYTGVIISFKFYSMRQNRTYYTIDMLVTRYNTRTTAN